MTKKLIVGLGNPGPEYELNRHNIGFIVLDDLAYKHKINISNKKELCMIGSGTIEGASVILAKPQTYMNKSGFGVGRLLGYFKLEPKDLIVVHDDLDLEFGQLKIKETGGHGGHNGVRSIIEVLSNPDFVRLRVGIDRPPGRMPAEKYVLSNFSQTDEELSELIETCVSAVEAIITEGIIPAMNRFH
jgi:PTH1 family peptidyl-tRNA hydrolase